MIWKDVVAPLAVRKPPSVIAAAEVVRPADNVTSTLKPRIGVVAVRDSVTGTLTVGFTVVTRAPGEPALTVDVGSTTKLALMVRFASTFVNE